MNLLLASSDSAFLGGLTTILSILGSLGVFLYGMKVMSEGVQSVAGDKMRVAMATMTKNRFSGMLTGLGTTALIQSSSATTVLVVSFVNAGLLTLVESIGVIMGANLGTTVTAWIIAVVGKFSIAKVALPIIGVGLPLFFVGRSKIKSFGEVLIGFGLLFFGLGLLKKSVPDVKGALKSGETGTVETIQWLIETINNTGFGSVVLFMIAGVILTLVVQSSSAAMAITITCATQGWLGDLNTTEGTMMAFQNSAAIVLGENIGTTVTAWLASIGTGVNAKRAARAHFLFNVIGVIWMLALFKIFTPLVWEIADMLPDSLKEVKKLDDSLAEGTSAVAFANASKVAFSTAIFHTMFNLANIFMLIWFVPQISNVVQKWVKEKKTDEAAPRLRYISQNLVDLGELNIAEAETAIRRMSNLCVHMFKGFVDVLDHPKDDMSAEVTALKKIEDESDLMMQDITEYLVRCSSRDIGNANAHKIAGMLRITQELEEGIDCIYRLVKLNERRYKKGRTFSKEQTDTIREFAGNTQRFIEFTDKRLLSQISDEDMNRAEAMEDTSDTMRKKFNKNAMNRMASGDVRLEMINIDINNHFESIANHTLNIVQASHSMHEA
ncbi:Na/Pi cotransporter family protein [Verrucomicrobiaceae bacterium N1E253]|uniref:Na/Pi cotransporter family protein n=1 Tax=Oceaniferula marina TaxID=2748318 RepID=A0A851GJ35_9BACT|nr:Na/Pi cotransporter family protein [Oceaniferula marina]NWK54670.1 Na/Pi cotransporter family protein [Oceaniferula marina]